MADAREHFPQVAFRSIIVLVGGYSRRYGAVLQELLGAQVEIRFAKSFDASIELIVDPRVTAIILDCNTADGDPRAVFRDLKAAGHSTHIITMLPRQSTDDHHFFLAAGAAGVFFWPFDINRLVLKCRELIDMKAAQIPKEARVGTLWLDLESTEIYCGAKLIKLQPRQHDLLSALLLNGNRVCPREYLAGASSQQKTKAIANALDRSISRLRMTFQELKIDVEIRTVRGLGYILRSAPAAVESLKRTGIPNQN